MSTITFRADAVLFDMDGTLTDSIAAVEAAWGKLAKDIGQDPEHVIAATHGKRAIDNLAIFKSHILPHEMDGEVQNFEDSILFFADAYANHGPGSRKCPPYLHTPESALDSEATTPALTPGITAPSSRACPLNSEPSRRPSFVSRLSTALVLASGAKDQIDVKFVDASTDELQVWQIEAAAVDRSVRILPGVKKMIDSIPDGRYAVATSGAKTYAYGCMTRVGITPPPVTITADDKRLKAGKPAPDPFLLAAKCLGFDAQKCVVFEDSPSGIRAGVASGAIVIAVCTSHERSKIENCGAHFIIDNMEKVKCEAVDGELLFTILA
ncbi:HAD-like protein [Lentinula aciculospora]|uniref:HAD-like protein n=1 Tax=Lentinula aciculospora TaxID=153920 RepID=A0A9W9AEG9_9AGAR|nr:HAD-like protein [Lentinula aciculospora]